MGFEEVGGVSKERLKHSEMSIERELRDGIYRFRVRVPAQHEYPDMRMFKSSQEGDVLRGTSMVGPIEHGENVIGEIREWNSAHRSESIDRNSEIKAITQDSEGWWNIRRPVPVCVAEMFELALLHEAYINKDFSTQEAVVALRLEETRSEQHKSTMLPHFDGESREHLISSIYIYMVGATTVEYTGLHYPGMLKDIKPSSARRFVMEGWKNFYPGASMRPIAEHLSDEHRFASEVAPSSLLPGVMYRGTSELLHSEPWETYAKGPRFFFRAIFKKADPLFFSRKLKRF